MKDHPPSERPRRDDLSSPSDAPLDERARRYRTLFGAMEEGFCVVEMVFDEAGRALDYHFLEFNDAFERMTGITAEAALAGRSARELFPTLEAHWFETYGRVAATGESVRFENRAEAMGKWFEVHAFRIEGREVGILFKDVTERRAAQAAMEAERARQDETLAAAQVATFDWDVPNDLVHGNPLLSQMFGIERGGALPVARYFDAIHPDDREAATAALQGSMARGGRYETQFRVSGAGGRARWGLARGDTRLGPDGSPLRVSGVVLDVTERVMAEEALRRSEAGRSLALDSAGIGAWNLDLATSRLTTDERFRAIFGVSEAEVADEPAVGAIHPDDRERVRAAVAAATRAVDPAPYAIEYRVVHPDGAVRWVFAQGRTNQALGVATSLDGTLIDVTERKRTEAERERLIAELEVERGRLRSLFAMSPSAIAVIRGDDLRFEYANDAYHVLVGRDDVAGKSLFEALPDIEGQGFDTLLRGVMATGEPFVANEVPVLLRPKADEPARTVFVNFLYQAMRESDGRVSGVFAHVVDVTDQVRSRQSLEIEQAKLRTIFEQAPAIIAVLRGRDLVFEYVNEGYYQTTGHRPMVGLTFVQALPEAAGGGEGRDYDRLLREIMDAGEPRTFAERPVMLQRTAGAEPEERFLDLAYLPLREADGEVSGILVHGIDVTESVRAKLERERLVAELAAEREMLDTVLTLSPSFVTIIRGEDLVFEYANPAYKRAVGREDLVGRTLTDALPEVVTGGAAGQEYDRFLLEVIHEGKTIDFPRQPIQLLTSPGKLEDRVLDFTYMPLRDHEGQTTGVLVHGIDVTDQARAERDVAEREELFRTVFEQAPDDAILVMDGDRTITAWNPAAERICGWTVGEAVGRLADLIFTPEDRSKGAPADEAVKAVRLGKAEDERWHQRKDGTRFWGSGTMNSLHNDDGSVRGYLKVFRDATARYEEAQTLAFLSRLADTIVRQRAAGDAIPTCERMLGERLGASRVAYAEAGLDGLSVTIRDEWAPGLPSLLGTYPVDRFTPGVAEAFDDGRTHVSRDAELEFEGPALERIRSLGTRSALSVPLKKEGRLAGVLIVHDRAPRDWTEAETALARQVADRLLAETDRARAEADLRASEERFRVAQEATPEAFTIIEAVRDATGAIVDFRYAYANPAARRLVVEDDAIGSSVCERRESMRGTELFRAYVRTVETGVPFNHEMPIESRAGRRYMRLTVSKVGDGAATSVTDITERYVEAQTLAFLTLLTDAVIDERDADRIIATVERMLGQYLGASRVTFGEFTEDEEAFVIRTEWGSGVPSVLGTYRLSQFGSAAVSHLRSGRTYVVRDATAEVEEEAAREAIRATGAVAGVTIPILKDGRLAALVVANQDVPRDWTPDEIDLVKQVADRLAAEIERARAETALRTSEERFRQLVELSPVTVWFGEPDGGLSYISQDFYDATGLEPDDALPHGWASVVHPDDLPVVAADWAAARRDEAPYDTEFRIRHRDGVYRWISARALPVRDAAGGVTGWLGSNSDIQERKSLEETLQARVSEATKELQKAVTEAEGFNYSISHDLRAPLRAMSATASILIEEAGPELSEEHREMLVRQAENAHRLGRLIDELLRLSRLARVEVRRQPLDMTQKVRNVAAELAESEMDNGCRIVPQEGMTAEGDPGLVRTVLHNLIGNACKFSPAGGTVWVGETAGTFWVRDEGVGFDMRFAPKIFLPFERLVSEAEFPGTGIGLANVKRIVERHRGKAWVDSEPGKGTTFYFTLA